MCIQSVKDRTIKNKRFKKTKGKVELGNWEQKVRILGTGHGAEPGVSSSVEQGVVAVLSRVWVVVLSRVLVVVLSRVLVEVLMLSKMLNS